jgi:YVTN family beta-propeller protein
MKKSIFLSLLAGLLLSFTACKKTDEKPEDTGFLYGAYVINEGSFMNNNGSISYIDLDSSYIINNLFYSVNGRTPGDVVQSFTVAGDKGLIVVNNSAKVEVVDMKSFTSLGTITGCNYPRYALPLTDNKVYLTNGSLAGNVYILDLDALAITDSIAVGYGPENLVRSGDHVFVANSGGWSNDSTVSVIDVNSDKVLKTIVTGDNPVDLAVDQRGDVWVLCKGKVVYDQNWNIIDETDSRLQKIDASSLEITEDFVIGQKGDYFNPQRLTVSSQGRIVLYLEHDGVFAVLADNPSISDNVLIGGSFYGLDADPASGLIYVTDARDFSSAGVLYRYRPDGFLQDSVSVGIAPNGVYFNEK